MNNRYQPLCGDKMAAAQPINGCFATDKMDKQFYRPQGIYPTAERLYRAKRIYPFI
jgi:hypothetical protein